MVAGRQGLFEIPSRPTRSSSTFATPMGPMHSQLVQTKENAIKPRASSCDASRRSGAGADSLSRLRPHTSSSPESSARGEEFRSLATAAGGVPLLPPAGSGPIGGGTCARPGLGTLEVAVLPGEGQLSKLSQPPQPLGRLLIGDLARRVRGGRPTQAAPPRQQVMHAAARQLHCGTPSVVGGTPSY